MKPLWTAELFEVGHCERRNQELWNRCPKTESHKEPGISYAVMETSSATQEETSKEMKWAS